MAPGRSTRIILMIKFIGISSLSTKNSLSSLKRFGVLSQHADFPQLNMRRCGDLIRTSVYDEYSVSIKNATHLDHISHCRRASGTYWLNGWTYRVCIINTRPDKILRPLAARGPPTANQEALAGLITRPLGIVTCCYFAARSPLKARDAARNLLLIWTRNLLLTRGHKLLLNQAHKLLLFRSTWTTYS